MTKLRYVELKREVHSPEFAEVPEHMVSPGRTVFVGSDELSLDLEGDRVRIVGKHGVILVPWADCKFVREQSPEEPALKLAGSAKPTRGGK